MGKLRVFESFSGVGCQSLALRNIGIDYEVVGISEVDKHALLCYDAIHNDPISIDIPDKQSILDEIHRCNIAYNFSSGKSEIPKNEKDLQALYVAHKRSKNFGDIRKIDEKSLPDFDLFTYSYPCKNISIAGKQAGFTKGSDTQSSLVWECERIIKAKRPKYLLMENVKNLVSKRYIDVFNTWCKTLEDLGYNNYWKVLNGKDFGVPQNRERVMMVSILKEHDQGYIFPDGYPLTTRLKDILEPVVDEKYYVKDDKGLLSKIKIIEPSDTTVTYRLGGLFDESDGKRHQAGSVWDIECISHTLDTMQGGWRQPCILAIPQATKKGYIEFEVDGIVDLSYPSSTKRRGRVIDGGKLCHSLTTNMQRIYYIDYNPETVEDATNFMEKYLRIRRLTPLECWLLMGHKKSDYFKAESTGISESKLYERAGRGIVIPMLEDIFKNMFGGSYEKINK